MLHCRAVGQKGRWFNFKFKLNLQIQIKIKFQKDFVSWRMIRKKNEMTNSNQISFKFKSNFRTHFVRWMMIWKKMYWLIKFEIMKDDSFSYLALPLMKWTYEFKVDQIAKKLWFWIRGSVSVKFRDTSVWILSHWGQNKMAAILQMTLSNPFSWMKILEFR